MKILLLLLLLHYSPWWALASRLIGVLDNEIFFRVSGRQPDAPTPNLEDQWAALFVWSLPFNLSGLGGPTRNLTPASIALRVVTGHTNLPATVRQQPLGRKMKIHKVKMLLVSTG
jgi:hypothetical protein